MEMRMLTFLAQQAIANGASLLIVQKKLIAAQWALIAANEKLISLGERPLHPKDFGETCVLEK